MRQLLRACAFLLCAFSLFAAVSPSAKGRRLSSPASGLSKGTLGRRGAEAYREELRYLYGQRRRLAEKLGAVEQALAQQTGFSFGVRSHATNDANGANGANDAGNARGEGALEVALSTEEEPMSCRILIEAEPGAKVIAPCDCQGTLKWIQFSEFNHLRRQEPEKWQVCNLCKAPFRTKHIYDNSGLSALALAAVLDSPKYLRLTVLTSLAASLFVFRHLIIAAVTWFINSKYLWQTRSIWAVVVYGGAMTQLMLLRMAVMALWEGYKRLEEKAKSTLTSWETKLIEQSLRVNTPRG